MVINVLFKKTKKYIVQIPRQGGSYMIGTVEAKDLEDAKDTAMELLETELRNPTVRRAKYYHLVDTDNGQRIKVKNPFYDPALAEKKKDKEINPKELEEYTYLQILDNLGKSMGKFIPQLFDTMIKANMDMITEMSKEMIKRQVQGNTYDNLYKIGFFISQLVELAKNKDKVIDLVKDLKESGVLGQFLGSKLSSEGEENAEPNTEDNKESE